MTSDPIFQKTLQDLVKGIRSNKKDPSVFISQQIADIKIELRHTDPYSKAEAVRKLTYLQMLGYNVSWASFAIVEVMSQPRFAHKRIGYLAANQSFNESTDVILLTTNLFKKEFTSSTNNQYEMSMAINCLANIATPDLARDCISDLVILMNHSRPYVRKKAVLGMFKLYIKYPQGLRLTFEKLKDRLEDNECSVVSAAVNVICELANKNPRNYLAMAPKFFRLLTTSSNNWMLIKVVKLLGSLVSEEPRLARKLLDPLVTIIQNTGAKSLQYECIHTITQALPYTKRDDGSDTKNVPSVIKLCSDYLKIFIEDIDQNLKYLGLVGLVDLMQFHPRSVVEHRDLVLRCLNDEDITIRSRALELLAGIVSKKSLMDLVKHLLEHLAKSEGSYGDEIISKVLSMCGKEKYSLVTDFSWYISVLQELAGKQGSKHGSAVALQLMDVTLRVAVVRPYAVEAMLSMLLDDTLILGPLHSAVSEVLKAAAWIAGEYADVLDAISEDTADDDDDDRGYWFEGVGGDEVRSAWRGQPLHLLVLQALLHTRTMTLAGHVQAVFLQAAMKVFVRACCSQIDLTALAAIVAVLHTSLDRYLQSVHIEVQERASTLLHLLMELKVLSSDQRSGGGSAEDAASDLRGATAARERRRLLSALLSEASYPVHSKAQRRVPPPEGVAADQPFSKSALQQLLSVELPEQASLAGLSLGAAAAEEVRPQPPVRQGDRRPDLLPNKPFAPTLSADLPMLIPPSNSARPTSDSAFYLSASNSTARQTSANPLSKLLADTFDDIDEQQQPIKKSKKDRKKDKSRPKKPPVELNRNDLLPAGALSSEDERDGGKRSAVHDSLDQVDLVTPLRPDEVLVVPTHRQVTARGDDRGRDRDGDRGRDRDRVRDLGMIENNNYKSNNDNGKKSNDKKKKRKEKKNKEEAMVDFASQPVVQRPQSVVGDLLSLDWRLPAQYDLFDAPAAAPTAVTSRREEKREKKDKKEKKDKNEKKDKSSKSGASDVASDTVIFQNRHVTISCSSRINANSSSTFTMFLTVLNSSSDGALVGRLQLLDVCCESGRDVRLVQDTPLLLAQDLPAGKVTTTLLELIISGSNLTLGSAVLICNLRQTVDALLGPETSLSRLPLSVTSIAYLAPHTASEDEFAALLGKSSSRWAAASVKLTLHMDKKRPLAMWRLLAKSLNAHMVDSGDGQGRAASYCAKVSGWSTGYLCALAKLSKDDSTVSLDVKCLCSSKSDSQGLASDVGLQLTLMHR